MGLFDFISSAGSKIFGGKKPSEIPNLQVIIRDHVGGLGLPIKHIHYFLEEEVIAVAGWVNSLAIKEKVILAVGNVEGVDKVEDRLVVGEPPQMKHAPAPTAAAPAATESVESATEAHIDLDQLPTAAEAEANQWTSGTHTVKSGDSLSKIAKEVYGSANKYMVIFEANKPMLSDPNKIYPGQVLRIPELGDDV